MFELARKSPELCYQIPLMPDYDTFVVNTHLRDTEIDYLPSGTTWLDRWQMNDDTEYDLLYGEPKDLRTDVLVAFTTPLGTQVNGRSKLLAAELMELGF